MNFTYYGHACFAVEIENKTLLFDPFITGNPLAKAIDVQNFKADYILVSHGHQDHLADAAAIAKRTGVTVIAPFEVAQWLGKQGAPKTHPVNHGGGCQFDFGRVKLVNAIHSSSLPDGAYGGNPGGFVVESDYGNFYYSGDTADARHGIDRRIRALGLCRSMYRREFYHGRGRRHSSRKICGVRQHRRRPLRHLSSH